MSAGLPQVSMRFVSLALVLLILFFSGCSKEPEKPGPRYAGSASISSLPAYRIGVHPLHNPIKMNLAYSPLISFLNQQHLNCTFSLIASRDYGEFEKKYQEHKLDFLLPNPWQTLQAMKTGYFVIAMAGAPEDFKGIFLVRRDSGLKHPTDLRGKAVSYPSRTALAACIMPQYFLHSQGINVTREIDNRYVGSQESSIMNVYLKRTAAAATWPNPWHSFQKEHPQEASELELIWETPSLINNSFMAHRDLPPSLVKKLQEVLVSLPSTPAGKNILDSMETAYFRLASDTDYDIVRSYVASFEAEVRPVQE